MVELVSYLNGAEQRIVGNASTKDEAVALTKEAACGDGWGYRIRGTTAELEAVGAYRTLYGAWVLPHDGSFIDCSVRMNPHPTNQ